MTVFGAHCFFSTTKTFRICIVRTCLFTAFIFVQIHNIVNIALNESRDLMINRCKLIMKIWLDFFSVCSKFVCSMSKSLRFYRTWKFLSVTCPFLGAYTFQQFFNCDLSMHITVVEWISHIVCHPKISFALRGRVKWIKFAIINSIQDSMVHSEYLPSGVTFKIICINWILI